MSVRMRMAGAAVAVLCLVAPQAQAFFPFGGFTEAGQLRYMTWPLRYLDVNGDGDVGPNEGVLVTFEGGDRGWTQSEMAVLRQGFDVWANIPTSYMAFRYTDPVTEPLRIPGIEGVDFVFRDFSQVDFINYIAVLGEGEPQLPPGVLGVTLLTVLLEDSIIENPYTGIAVPVTGGQIIDCDIVYAGPLHRSDELGTEPPYALLDTHVHEIGHFIGLGHTPLNNFSESIIRGDLRFLEEPVFAQRNAAGLLDLVGVTPTMFPYVFYVNMGGGESRGGMQDLAPDDIAGASFLYPRGSQDRFFSIEQEARSQSRSGFPSNPLPGGHIIAWSDADNNVTTRRVPLISTMVGLYENEMSRAGRFSIKGLQKQHETITATAFNASYVLTLNPLNGLDDAGQSPADMDSTHVLFGSSAFTFLTAFPSEVFREGGNILGIEQREQGTPLVFDPLRGRVLSANSGRTLETMLPGTRPMFGDPNDVCPLNVVVAGLTPGRTPAALRGLRDGVLLETAAGTAFMDAYYRVAPGMAAFLLRNERAYAAARGAMTAAEWVYDRAEWLLAVFAGLFALMLTRAARSRRRATAAGLMLLAGLALATSPAHGLLIPMTPEELVAHSDNVITAKVETVESYWVNDYQIATDITFTVTDTMKGRMNKNAQFAISQPGGRVGAVQTIATSLPSFVPGEEIVLFVEARKNASPMVVCGERGKWLVSTDPETGEKTVGVGSPVLKKTMLKTIAKSRGEEPPAAESVEDDRVSLEDCKEYLRALARAQRGADAR